MANGKVNWYLKEVNASVNGATDDVLAGLAFQIAGLAQRNITVNGQVDTGFMRSSTYAVSKRRSSYMAARAEAMAKTWSEKQKRSIPAGPGDIAPERTLPQGKSAGVVIAAVYAVFQELRIPFLYPAALEGARQAGGTAQAIYREKVRDRL